MAEDLNPSSSEIINLTCDSCEKQYNNKFKNVMDSRNVRKSNIDHCLKCSRDKAKEKRKLSYNFVYNYFESKGCHLLEKNYINNNTKMNYICFCGEASSIKFSDFQNGNRCKNCGLKNKKTVLLSYDYIKDFFAEHGCTLLTKKYTGNTQKLNFICKCGLISLTTFNAFMYSKRCKNCGRAIVENSIRYSYEFIEQLFKDKKCILITNSKKYKNTNSIVIFKCYCGNIDTIKVTNFMKNDGCQKCREIKSEKFGKRRKGDLHPSWNPDITPEERLTKRNYPEYKEWVKEVYRRDWFTCKCCNRKKGVKLVAHHLDGYNWCKEGRVDINNGITLCKECHTDFHSKYGSGNNTRGQWIEYLKTKKLIKLEVSCV